MEGITIENKPLSELVSACIERVLASDDSNHVVKRTLFSLAPPFFYESATKEGRHIRNTCPKPRSAVRTRHHEHEALLAHTALMSGSTSLIAVLGLC